MIAVFLFCLILITLAPGISQGASVGQGSAKVGLYIDGQILVSEDQPILTQGRTLVPLRVLMETLGAKVEWDPEYRSITVTGKDSAFVRLWADNRLICYGGAPDLTYDVCDVAPMIINNRTYVPLRLVAGALGMSVDWDGNRRAVLVDTARVGDRTRFFDLSVNGLQAGQTLTGGFSASLSYGSAYPAGASKVKYMWLDPKSGAGKTVAATADIRGSVTVLPDASMNGPGVFAAAICDSAGDFIAGTAVGVNARLEPKVSLTGLTQGQVISGETRMGVNVNFLARGVEYEFTELSNGISTRSLMSDPFDTYTHEPPAGQKGQIAIKAIAYDTDGSPHGSEPVTIMADMPEEDKTPRVNLRNIKQDHVGKIPVVLSISRNFDATLTQYWARNANGGRTVLLDEKPYGDYSWFPGPDMAGDWDIYVTVAAPGGKTYTSNVRRVSVSASPSLALIGVGPGQVITSDIKISSKANVALSGVEYVLSNPFNGSKKVLGQAADTDTSIAWTPEKVNEGERRIQAIGTLANGQTISSEVLTVKVFLGQFHTAKPLVPKESFIDLIAPMALASQKSSGMSAALQIAQAILETGWGQSLPVDRYSGLFSYNLFGIKGRGPAGSVLSSTQEEYLGTLYRTDANFRAYHNAQESWDDHKALLLRAERYQAFRDIMYNNIGGAFALKRCGYATDSAYPDKLINLIKQHGLDRFDTQKL